jgi:hypothetical protein
MRTLCLLGALLAPALLVARCAAAEDRREGFVALRAGAYRLFDRSESAYDGPSLALRAEAPLGNHWGAVGELGTAGEFAGGRGSCLGQISTRLGASLVARPGPPWFHVDTSGGVGVVFARLYGSLLGSSDPDLVARADRWLPQLWASVDLALDFLGAWSASAEILAGWVPPATFRPDHVPAGMLPDYYPVYRREHDLSTYAGTIGLAYRF